MEARGFTGGLGFFSAKSHYFVNILHVTARNHNVAGLLR